MKKLSKQQALEVKEEAHQSWTGNAGLITLYPAHLSNTEKGHLPEFNYDSENQLLWTGEFYTLCKIHGIIDYDRDKERVTKALAKHQVKMDGVPVPGLYSRHPDPYRLREVHHGISWDEMNGLSVLSKIFDLDVSTGIVEYGSQNGWVFIDEEPFTWKADRVRQGRDIAFYKITAGYKTVPWNVVWMLVSHAITSFKEKGDTSGKLMAWMRLETIKDLSLLYLVAYEMFMWKMRMTYGKYPLSELIKIYFRDPNHPFHRLAQGM